MDELLKSETNAKKLMSKMKVQNQDLVAKGRQAYKDIKQAQIVHEKEKYELYLKIKEQGHILKATKRDLKEKEELLMLAKHQEAVEASKKMLADSGQGSFLKSENEKAADIFATPSPDKRKKSVSNGGEGTIEVLATEIATGDTGDKISDKQASEKNGSE